MYSKNNNFKWFFLLGILTLGLIASLGFYISRPQNAAVAQVKENIHQVSKPISTPTSQSPVEILSKTVNDVTVNVKYAKIINTGIEIGICYTTLDGGEWYPTPGHLFYNSYEIFPDEYGFTTEDKATNKKTGERCAFVRYHVDELDSITIPIQFSLASVRAIAREMPACQNFQERLESNVKAQSKGLIAKCIENSDGSISVNLSQRDSKLISEDNAKKELDNIVSGVIDGPWEFTITTIEK